MADQETEQHQPSDATADAAQVAANIAPSSDQPDDYAIRMMAADKIVQDELDGPDTRDMAPPPAERPETQEDEDDEQRAIDGESDDDARTEDVAAKGEDGNDTEDEEPEQSKPGDKPAHWKVGQARRYKRQADDAVIEARGLMGQVEQAKLSLDRQAAELAPFQAIAEKARSGDIEAAIDELARRAGMQPHDVLERYVRRKAGEPDYQRGPSPEIVELREELRAMREERRTEREQWQREQQQAQFHARVSEAINECMEVQSNDRLSRLWPHAASLPAPYLREQLRAMVPNAMQRGTASALDDMMATIDAQAKVLQNHYHQVRGDTGGSNGAAKTQAKGKPATAKPDNSAPQLSNESAAATVSGRRAKTADEIAAEVDAIAAQAAEDYLKGNVL